MTIPVIGRLSLVEWPMVTLSFLATYMEFVVAIITTAIPSPLIQLVTKFLHYLHGKIVGKDDFSTKESIPVEIQVRNKIRAANDIHEIGHIFGYEIHDHVVTTKDGYVLTLHRIKSKRDGAPVVYFHHGLLMCSDIWVCKINKNENLPFVLHDLGYDVWLGNNRGNKYCSKHLLYKSSETRFWDFSIDEFALYDIPDSIDHVLQYTKQNSVTYIGFSQGSAQIFASLSVKPGLNEKINLVIAIAPAMTPEKLHNPLVDSLIKASPNIMYLMFGKKTLIPSATFWENIVYPPLFVRIIDLSIKVLFDWKSRNINFDSKISCYSHLYSPTSVKSVVHWFQIIRNAQFQMYDEVVSITSFVSRSFRPLNFPTKTNITVPIRLLYGGIDSLVDIERMLKLLPEKETEAYEIPNHEHLDLIWSDHVEELVISKVVGLLKNHDRKTIMNGSAGESQKVTSLSD